MHVIVTAGPTVEPLDQVRRLTNFSTGRLGCELANYLTAQGHQVTLLLSEQATYREPIATSDLHHFTTTNHLKHLLSERAAPDSSGALCHAAAVSDFKFGQMYQRNPDGELIPLHPSGKIASRDHSLMMELVPTEKIIASLRSWFPRHFLVGWKFEVEGNQEQALNRGGQQLAECHTHGCVVNGPAYGDGFGWVTRPSRHDHLADAGALYETIHQSLDNWKP